MTEEDINRLYNEIDILKSRVEDLEVQNTHFKQIPVLMPGSGIREVIDRLNNIIVYLNRSIRYGKKS